METESHTHGNQTIMWWISSLASSVVCCAVLFVVFAGYFVEVKQNIEASKVQLDTIDQRLTVMTAEMEAMRRHMPVSASVAPASPAPAAAAPIAVTPPTAAPTTIPEVPAKP
jgi:hypothetical protein